MMTLSVRQRLKQKRARARELLVKAGHQKAPMRYLAALLYAIEVEMGEERNCEPDEWIDLYLKRFDKPPVKREPPAFRPLRLSPQWLINVERARQAQPRLWTPDGIGNGAEGQHGYGRGR